MTLATIIPVPPTVQAIAWSQAYTLLTDHLERMDPTQVAIVADIARRKANTLDWTQCQDARRLFSRVVES